MPLGGIERPFLNKVQVPVDPLPFLEKGLQRKESGALRSVKIDPIHLA